MSQTRTSAADPGTSGATAAGQAGQRTVNVSFTFNEDLEIQLGSRRDAFPPGGGLGTLEIRIEPLHLAGLDAAALQAAIRKRAGDLAMVAEALALASVQFADAVSEPS